MVDKDKALKLAQWTVCKVCGAATLTTHPEADSEVVAVQLATHRDYEKRVMAAVGATTPEEALNVIDTLVAQNVIAGDFRKQLADYSQSHTLRRTEEQA